MTKIYGHRGAKGDYPENTLLSFKKALEAGVDGIELDVHLTKDDELVVIHDSTLERTTTGKGQIKNFTLEELKTFSAGAKFKSFEKYEPSWDEEKIPTLKETLKLLAPYNVELNIELKTYEVKYKGIEQKVLQDVSQFGYSSKVVYSSFHLPTIAKIKKIDPSANIAGLWMFPISHPLEYMSMLNLEAFHMSKEAIFKHPELWGNIAEKVRVWTVNEEEDFQKLLDLGVEAIITDFPQKALELRG
ncbi:MAG: glycerophosphodiester phosphodiesterase [Defluviitaleaceae bacterium]|nr:glycerophosphodiester phosphodiesterase [Defluviitaleaceae bacterium]